MQTHRPLYQYTPCISFVRDHSTRESAHMRIQRQMRLGSNLLKPAQTCSMPFLPACPAHEAGGRVSAGSYPVNSYDSSVVRKLKLEAMPGSLSARKGSCIVLLIYSLDPHYEPVHSVDIEYIAPRPLFFHYARDLISRGVTFATITELANHLVDWS